MVLLVVTCTLNAWHAVGIQHVLKNICPMNAYAHVPHLGTLNAAGPCPITVEIRDGEWHLSGTYCVWVPAGR